MRVLILGGDGMAGHVLVDYLPFAGPYEVLYTVRRPPQEAGAVYLDVRQHGDVVSVLDRLRPQVVINAVGLLNKQAQMNVADAIRVNALLPHVLAEHGNRLGFRLIHISTDCVFSGLRGSYTEYDEKDGLGVYGQTKSLGEVDSPLHLTLRTSIVGPEIRSHGIGLFQWFMRQKGRVYGYKNVLWNGITTLQLAKVIHALIEHPTEGILHITAPSLISKFDLLTLFQATFDKHDVIVEADESVQSNKTLASSRTDVHLPPVPDYEDMLATLRLWMDEHSNRYHNG